MKLFLGFLRSKNDDFFDTDAFLEMVTNPLVLEWTDLVEANQINPNQISTVFSLTKYSIYHAVDRYFHIFVFDNFSLKACGMQISWILAVLKV